MFHEMRCGLPWCSLRRPRRGACSAMPSLLQMLVAEEPGAGERAARNANRHTPRQKVMQKSRGHDGSRPSRLSAITAPSWQSPPSIRVLLVAFLLLSIARPGLHPVRPIIRPVYARLFTSCRLKKESFIQKYSLSSAQSKVCRTTI